METLIQRLIQLSSELVQRMNECELEEIEAYMEARDIIFAELQQNVPAAEEIVALRNQVERILEMDTVITGRMTVLLTEANREISKINKGRRTKSIYETGFYGDDSVFFDTKR